MPDKKISQLTDATTPLAGTEVLPIVQTGSTVKVSVNNLTAGKSVSATSFVPTGSTVPANGMFLSTTNAVGFSTNTTEHWLINASGNFNPVGTKGIGTNAAPVSETVSTTFSTSAAAAGCNLSGSTLAADGTDTNIDVTITPKGSGSVNMAKVNIDGGSIDGTAIGAASVSSGAFSTITGVTTGNFDQTANFSNTNASYGGGVVGISGNRAGSTLWTLLDGANTGGVCITVYGNGNIANTNGVYGALSDVSLKQNITDATPKLNDVMKLKVRNFEFKSNPGLKQLGFIAQELEQVFPNLVDEAKDKNGDQVKHIKQSVLIPVLIKALQELKTEFDTYKALHP